MRSLVRGTAAMYMKRAVQVSFTSPEYSPGLVLPGNESSYDNAFPSENKVFSLLTCQNARNESNNLEDFHTPKS